MQLDGRVVVITGAGRGLGRSMARHLAAKGARLALIDLNPENLDETKRLLTESGAEAAVYVGNIAKEADVEAVFGRIMDDFGALHGLVNNAGITRDAMLIKMQNGKVSKRMSLEHWQQVIDVNLTGTFLCGREAATHMANAGNPGVIINIASIAQYGNAGQTNYSAAKAGVVAMTSLWARELAQHNIRTGAIAPGGIATEMVMAMPEQVRATMAKAIPVGRLGEPDEIAQAVSFIFENDYFNGRVIEIDGGLRI